MAARGGERLILQRRAREEQLSNNLSNVSSMKGMNSRAFWEQKGATHAVETQILNTMQHLQQNEEQSLHERRVRLAQLYNDEMDAWKETCLRNVETPEQRTQKMVMRARELKERREAERLANVRDKKMQQYREQCDDLRSLNSHRRTLQAVEGRAPQLKEREASEAEEREYEKRMALLWEEERKKKIQREERDKQEAIQRNVEVKGILDHQVKLYNERVEAETREKERDDQELLQLWDQQGRAEARKERRLKMEELKRAADVKQFNRERAAVQKESFKKERDYDLKLLTLALEREAATEAKEKALQEQFKREAIEYQEMLRRQMAIEEEDLSYLDDIRKRMEEEVWEKRDAVHQAEAQARESLLKAVLQSREEEINRQQQEKLEQAEADKVFMKQCQREGDEALQRELKAQEDRKRLSIEHSKEVQAQKEKRRLEEERIKQDEYLELKRMQLAEKQHKDMVQNLFKEKTSNNFRRKTAEWYFNS